VKFWIVWAIDVVIGVIVLYFFFVGLADGSVSSFNIGLWLVILFALAIAVAGSLWLKSGGRRSLAMVLLLIVAVPGVLFGLFLLLLLIAAPRWN
jgi:hypothetical protein